MPRGAPRRASRRRPPGDSRSCWRSLALCQAVPRSGARPATRERPAYPFGVGEEFQYVGKLGMLSLGTGSIAVVGLDTVRGVETFVFRFRLQASTFVFKMDDVMNSWTGTSDLVSRRFFQDFTEGDDVRRRYYEIYPDSGIYTERERDDRAPTVAQPLDDAAFFYFVRTVPLEVGQTYSFPRYFKQKMNPVTIKVEKRESCDLPNDRKTTCLVLHPVIDADRNGMFSPGPRPASGSPTTTAASRSRSAPGSGSAPSR